MNTTQPIRNTENLQLFKDYYKEQEYQPRNYTLIVLGLNTALRINDILHITWGDVYDFQQSRTKFYLEVKERKTGKHNRIALNNQIQKTLEQFFLFSSETLHLQICNSTYLFCSRKGQNQPLSRSQAFRIIKRAAVAAGYPEHVSCHSLRKTFGYHAWKQGVMPTVLMNIYNHSSYQITKRYLGIEQDDKDSVFLNIEL